MARKNSKTLSDFDTSELRLARLRNKAKLEIGEGDEELTLERVEELKALIRQDGKIRQ
jgi:hypothetical protein